MGLITKEYLEKMSLNEMQETHESEIELLNEIFQIIDKLQKGDTNRSELENKLFLYIDHVKEHFESEENFMKEYGDPTFEAHKMAHDMFIADINYAQMIWKNNDDIEKIISVVKKAPEWLISHVNTVDKPTADFLSFKMGQTLHKVEEEMSLDEIAFELELAGVNRDKMNKLLSSIKRSGFNAKDIDKKLEVMGYAPVFTIYD